jgi:hypothetical protein
MTFHLTPEVLRSTYDLLVLTRPFRGWKMPSSSEVIFRVLKTEQMSGDWSLDKKGRHVIRVSKARHHTLHNVIMTVAHEMCHMKDDTKAHHGWKFRRLAASVCRHHGFDRGQF